LNLKQKISFVALLPQNTTFVRKKLPTLADHSRVYHREEDQLLSAGFDGFGF
jgi:hypothetical protein